jgi:hypothetical protein
MQVVFIIAAVKGNKEYFNFYLLLLLLLKLRTQPHLSAAKLFNLVHPLS